MEHQSLFSPKKIFRGEIRDIRYFRTHPLRRPYVHTFMRNLGRSGIMKSGDFSPTRHNPPKCLFCYTRPMKRETVKKWAHFIKNEWIWWQI